MNGFVALILLVLVSLASSTSICNKAEDQQRSACSFISRLNDFCRQIPDLYQGVKPESSPSTGMKPYIQLLLLEYLHFQVSQFGHLMSQTSVSLNQKQDLWLIPTEVTFTQSVLCDIILDRRLWGEVSAFSRLNIELVDSLLGILSGTAHSWSVDQQAFSTMQTEFRLISSAQNKLASHLTERFKQNLREFELSNAIRHSQDLQYVAFEFCSRISRCLRPCHCRRALSASKRTLLILNVSLITF